jgi:DNA-binding FrmR family transcriptional regulator
LNKQLKLEKKKAQYSRRLRALEGQVAKLQALVKEQHALIQILRSITSDPL